MRVSREQAAKNRERVLDVAARLFRERGFDGVGVADLMKAAGLTHGGFYGHFASKEDLMAQAWRRALAGSLYRWSRLAADAPEGPLRARRRPTSPLRIATAPARAACWPPWGRTRRARPAPVRRTVTDGLRGLVAALAKLIPGRSEAAKRERVLATVASLVGASSWPGPSTTRPSRTRS